MMHSTYKSFTCILKAKDQEDIYLVVEDEVLDVEAIDNNFAYAQNQFGLLMIDKKLIGNKLLLIPNNL